MRGRTLAAVLLGGMAAMAVAAAPAAAAGPTITFNITAGTAGQGGWYVSNVTADVVVSAATSTNCVAVVTLQQGSPPYSCTATDGTTTTSSTFAPKIDTTPPTVTGATPSRGPDSNGWYNAPVTVTFAGSDSVSGIASCTKTTYSGPDSGNATVTGTCTNVAGLTSGNSTFNLQYDATPPGVSASAARPPDANGWYNHPVAVTFTGSDATSGIGSCSTVTYSGPDSSSASVSGGCTDNAGNSASGSFSLQYDATAPTMSATLSRPPDKNGWYNHPVRLHVTARDPVSGLAKCTGGRYAGPDSDDATLTATCTNKAGVTATQVVTFKYDSTPPVVRAALARRPDAHGWYTHPVALLVRGRDRFAGIARCSGGRYTGPNSGSAVLTATCVNMAGRRATRRVTFRFDDNTPRLGGITVSAGDGTVRLRWTASAVRSVTIKRSPGPGGSAVGVVYRGDGDSFSDAQLRNGRRYRYELIAVTATGATITASVVGRPRALVSPRQGAVLVAPPLLRWSSVARASYYNVQLFFAGQKVLSVWPKSTKLQLPPRWRWHGHSHTLKSGDYRWYVWPGFGARTAAKYGQLLGGSVFVMKTPPT